MPRFRYKAIDSAGRPVGGEREAASLDALRDELAATGHSLESLEIEPIAEPDNSADETRAPSGADSSDLPLESGLRALSEEIPSRGMRHALRNMSDRLASGESIEQIVEADISGAPPALHKVLRIGVQLKQPGVVLETWLEHARRGAEMRRSIVASLSYSAFLFGVLAMVLVFFLTNIIPEFVDIFSEFGVELPDLTAAIIGVSGVLRNYGLILLIGLVVTVSGGVAACLLTGPRWRQQLVSMIPLIGAARRNLCLSTLCQLLAVLVERRIPVSAALEAAGAGSGDPFLESACHELAADVEQGKPVQPAAEELRLPARLTHLFRWWGHPEIFPEALRGSAAVFEGQSRTQARVIPGVIQPLVMFGVGLSVLLCVASLLLPLLRLISDMT